MERICPVCNSTIDSGDSRCPSCGFQLMGGTEEFQPITLDGDIAARRPQAQKTARIASLVVVSGPQTGMAYRLDDKELSVGRSPQCDIFLNDMTVSRSHAAIIPTEGGFTIRDSQSFNGTWINNESVDEALLADGDIIQIGAFCLKFEV